MPADRVGGSYPDVEQAGARAKASEYRALAKHGIDPIDTLRVESAAIPSFTTCTVRFVQSHRHGWKNAKRSSQWVSTLKTYVQPILGKQPVDQIDTEDVLKILTPVFRRERYQPRSQSIA